MPDFTVKKYTQLLDALKGTGHAFQTFEQFLTKPDARVIVLRHDVDKLPQNSLRTAKIEHGLGIRGVYNFRSVWESWDEEIIKEIHSLGHEIGYHYEELAEFQGDADKAFEGFKSNLNRLRKLVPVSTITMHGSPRSRHDSRDLWKKFDYRELDLIGEPYFDIDFSKVLYLTDTGRRWDGFRVNVRDKVDTTMYDALAKKGYPIRSTDDIIRAATENALPDRIMINFHPQRWHTNPFLWTGQLVFQNLKNVVKRFIH